MLFFCCVGLIFNASAQSTAFVRNEGQWPAQVHAQYAYQHQALWFQKDRIRMAMLDAQAAAQAIHAAHGEGAAQGTVSGHVYDVVFGNKQGNQVRFENELPDYLNFYLGNNPKHWATAVKQFELLQFKQIEDGIDLEWELQNGLPKYTFVVHPNASPQQVSLRYEGVRALELTDQGYLAIKLKGFQVLEQKPTAFQFVGEEQVFIDCAFQVNGKQLGFEIGQYNHDLPLYIDPVIIASTYSGSTAEAFGHSATFDGPGNIYSAGRVFGVGYPTDTGSFDLTYNGPFNPTPSTYFNAYDICISKYNPDGSQRLFSTYFGGATQELPHSLITNNNQELHVLGSTNSIDFPTTANAFDTSHNGNQDIFVAKFSADGTQLLGSTFLGGSQADGVNNDIVENFADEFRGEIVVDDANQIYIASFTRSANFPASNGALQTTLGGQQDGVVAKFNADLTGLLFATYLGGAGNDAAFGVKVNDDDEVYISGSTAGQGFPIPLNGNGAFPNFIGGNADAYIVALNATGTQILHGTYYGTVSREHAYFLELDNDGNPYIFGWSNGNITSTPGKYQGPSLGSFIGKFSPLLDTLIWQIGFGRYAPSAFLVDQCTQIYVSGQAAVNLLTGGPNNTMNLSTFDTLNPVNSQVSGGFHLTTFSPDADSIVSAFFYGPDSLHVDGGTSRFDKRGFVYQNVCDCTGQFPTTPWAFANSLQVNVPPTIPSNVCDNCVFKIDFEVPIVAAFASVTPAQGCVPHAAQFSNVGSIGSTHFWDFDDGTTSNLTTPSHVFDSVGVFEVRYVVSDSFGCNASDTASVLVTVLPNEALQILVDTVCADSIRIFANDSTLNNYLWSNGVLVYQQFVLDTGTYWLVANDPVCGLDTDSISLFWDKPFSIALPADTGVCELGFNLNAPAGFDAYAWNTGDTSQTINVASTGNYVLTVTQGLCSATDTVQVLISYVQFNAIDTVLCDTVLELTAQEATGTVLWSTGATTSSILVEQSGIYWVTISNGFCLISDTINVNIDPPLLNNINDTVRCSPLLFDVFDPALDAYLWNTGDTSSSVLLASSGLYWIEVSRGACKDRDTFNLNIEAPVIDRDSLVACDTNSIQLAPNLGSGFSYAWSTGDTIADPVFKAPGGIYTVTITGDACTKVDTLKVVFRDAPLVDLGEDRLVCDGAEFLLDAGEFEPGSRIVWSNGDTLSASQVSAPGIYGVTVSKAGCLSTDSVEVKFYNTNLDSFFLVPNVMTPNADGLNDVLGLKLPVPEWITSYSLVVYNRWGVLQFEADFLNHDWDGRTGGGTLVEQGTYYYILRAETRCTDLPVIEWKDNVTVLY